MGTLVEVGERIGIPADDLAELIELPVVASAMQTAAENPHWLARTIWKKVGRSSLYRESTGLKIESLRVELVKRRELATRTTDGEIVISPGRLRRAEKVARRRHEVISKAERLLTHHFHEPRAMEEARNILRLELQESEGMEL
jgi:hypothetical protein